MSTESAPVAAARSRTLHWQDPVATAAVGATMRGLEYMRAIVRRRAAAAADRRDDAAAAGRA